MADIIRFPEKVMSEEVVKTARHEALSSMRETFALAGWQASLAERAAEMLWAESMGFLAGALSAGLSLDEAMKRMTAYSGKRLRESVGLPPSL